MFIALIHWRIKPGEKYLAAFLQYWNERNSIEDRGGLIGEFLSETLPRDQFSYVTWHLDPESFGDFVSYVTVGLWQTAEAFDREVKKYFNDQGKLQPFEKYRRRRVVFNPTNWRIGPDKLPENDSPGVQ